MVSTGDGSLRLLSGSALHLEPQLHVQCHLGRMAKSATTLQQQSNKHASAMSAQLQPGGRRVAAPAKAISMVQEPLDGNILGESPSA